MGVTFKSCFNCGVCETIELNIYSARAISDDITKMIIEMIAYPTPYIIFAVFVFIKVSDGAIHSFT